MTTTTNEVNAAKKKEGEIISAIKAGKTVTTDGREFALTSHCGKERIALRVSNGGLIHACRDDIMGAAIVESGTDGEPVKMDTFANGVSKAAQAIHKLAELGEPFPHLTECIAAGQSPVEILESVEAAIADCEGAEPHWFEFTAYNSQAVYGYGTKSEADKYCDHLNKGREVNVYGYGIAPWSNEDYSDDWNNLEDELAGIAEMEAEAN